MERLTKSVLLFFLVLAITPACNRKQPSRDLGVDIAGMDTSVAPGDDFNAYTNGGWIKATPIPADKSSYGIGTILMDETRKRTLSLIQEAAKNVNPANTDVRKDRRLLFEFHGRTRDRVQGDHASPTAVGRVCRDRRPSYAGSRLGGELRADVDALNSTNFETGNLFGVWVTQGLKDPAHTYPYLLQGGLACPTAITTFRRRRRWPRCGPNIWPTSKRCSSWRVCRSARAAARVFALETTMAKVHATRVESEDVHSAVSWSRAELAAKAPGSNGTLFSERHGSPTPRF